MAPSRDTMNARFPALPVGVLSAETLHTIGVGRLLHFRTGPWVPLTEDGSRVLRVGARAEASLFTELRSPEPAPASPTISPRADGSDSSPPRPESRTVVFATASRRMRGGRAHRPRTRHRAERR